MNNSLKEFELVLFFGKGKFARDKLINAAAKGPQVNLSAIPSPQDNFRGDELRGADQRVGSVVFETDEFFGYSKIGKFQVPLRVDEQVLRFEVSINHSAGVAVLQSTEDACGVELGLTAGQYSQIIKNGQEIAPRSKFKQEENVSIVFQGGSQFNHEWAIKLGEDKSLILQQTKFFVFL